MAKWCFLGPVKPDMGLPAMELTSRVDCLLLQTFQTRK